jgi:hypothetical protein
MKSFQKETTSIEWEIEFNLCIQASSGAFHSYAALLAD